MESDEITRPKITLKDTTGSGYLVPAPLVHRLLWGVVISIVSVGLYMVRWNLNDTEWKTQTTSDLAVMVSAVSEIKDIVKSIPQREARLKLVEVRVERIENKVEDNNKETNNRLNRKADK